MTEINAFKSDIRDTGMDTILVFSLFKNLKKNGRPIEHITREYFPRTKIYIVHQKSFPDVKRLTH